MRPFRLASLFVFLATVCFAAKTSNISVTTYLADTDANGVAFMIQSDGQSGPKNGVVGEYDDGQQGISSILTANSFHNMPPGDWQFSALSSTTRSVRFTFGTNAVPFGAPGYTVTPNPPFTGTRSEPGHLEDVCTEIPNGSGSFNDMLLMAAGQVENCFAYLRFDPLNSKPTTFYRFEMTGNSGLNGANDPETTQLIVTCNSVGTDGHCNDWFIDPQPAMDVNGNVIPGTGIARLNFFGNKGAMNLGDYYLTFHFHVTRP